jgi:hypothetical protein
MMDERQFAISGKWALGSDGLQWILYQQRSQKNGGWKSLSFVRSTSMTRPVPVRLERTTTGFAPEPRHVFGFVAAMARSVSQPLACSSFNGVETFRSPDLGYLGYVDEDKVRFYRASTRRHTFNSEFDVSNIREFPKVDILYSYMEPNVAMIHALQMNGVKGIVFAGTGAGGLTDLERDAMTAILSPVKNTMS